MTLRTFKFACTIFLSLGLIGACSSGSDSSGGAPAPGGPPPAPGPDASADAGFPPASASDLQKTLDDVVAAGVAPGVVLAIEHPIHRTWAGSSGVANIATKEALSAKHRFRAGSVLKTAVATAVLQLVESGRRSLDDKLTTVLPTEITARIKNAEAVTVRMLLNHTSGVPDFVVGDFDALVAQSPGRVWTLTDHLDRVASQTPEFAPGAGWAYSNTNYLLLGEVLAATTGVPWRQTLEKDVFALIPLTETTLPTPGDTTCPSCSRGYEYIDDAPVDLTEVDPSMAGASGGASLVTTAGDLVKFLSALGSGRLFKKRETLDQMLQFVDASEPSEARTGYGLGLTRFQVGEVTLFGHLGGTAGFHSFMMLDPESGLVATGYMNRRGDLGAFIIPVLDALGRMK